MHIVFMVELISSNIPALISKAASLDTPTDSFIIPVVAMIVLTVICMSLSLTFSSGNNSLTVITTSICLYSKSIMMYYRPIVK